jgi:hypothetical protein
MDEDQLLVAYRARQPVDRLVHRQKREWVVQSIEPWTQEELRVFGAHEAANE